METILNYRILMINRGIILIILFLMIFVNILHTLYVKYKSEFKLFVIYFNLFL